MNIEYDDKKENQINHIHWSIWTNHEILTFNIFKYIYHTQGEARTLFRYWYSLRVVYIFVSRYKFRNSNYICSALNHVKLKVLTIKNSLSNVFSFFGIRPRSSNARYSWVFHDLYLLFLTIASVWDFLWVGLKQVLAYFTNLRICSYIFVHSEVQISYY